MIDSTSHREADVISAVELLASVEDFQSITITLVDPFGVYCAVLATHSLGDSGMIRKLSTERGITSVHLQRTV